MRIEQSNLNQYFFSTVNVLSGLLRDAGSVFQRISEVFEMLGEFFKTLMDEIRDVYNFIF